MMYGVATLSRSGGGPHEHVDQTDGFAFIGPSDFRLYLWDARPDSPTLGHRTVMTVGASNPRRCGSPRESSTPIAIWETCPAWCSTRPTALRGLGQERAGRRDQTRGGQPRTPHGLTGAVLPEDDHGAADRGSRRFMVPSRAGLEHERQSPSPRHRPVARPRIRLRPVAAGDLVVAWFRRAAEWPEVDREIPHNRRASRGQHKVFFMALPATLIPVSRQEGSGLLSRRPRSRILRVTHS